MLAVCGNEVYVAHWSEVLVVHRDGTVLRGWHSRGNEEIEAIGVTTRAIFVLTRETCVQVFRRDGSLVRAWMSGVDIGPFAVDESHVYMCDQETVYSFTHDCSREPDAWEVEDTIKGVVVVADELFALANGECHVYAIPDGAFLRKIVSRRSDGLFRRLSATREGLLLFMQFDIWNFLYCMRPDGSLQNVNGTGLRIFCFCDAYVLVQNPFQPLSLLRWERCGRELVWQQITEV